MRISTTAFTLAALYGGAQALRITDKDELERQEAFYAQVDADVNAEIEATIGAERRQRTPDQFGFFRGDDWKARTASEKFELLWDQVVADDTMQDYMWSRHDENFTQRSQTTFCQNHDELPHFRAKTTHTQGVVAHISWVPEADTGYTGLYENGTDIGIMRLSETGFITEESEGLFPSMAIKILHNERRSSTLLGMQSFHPSTSWNFFAEPLKSRVDPFVPEDENGINDQLFIDTIQKKLVEANPIPFATGLHRPAWLNEDGSENDEVVLPFMLEYEVAFDPSSIGMTDAKEVDGDGNMVMWYDQLARLEAGSPIFDVYATNHPEGINDTSLDGIVIERKKIATIVLNSPLVTSAFGDKRLFFQHYRSWDDLRFTRQWWWFNTRISKHDPENTWEPNNVTIELPEDDDASREIIMQGIREYQCPFAWLLGLVSVDQ